MSNILKSAKEVLQTSAVYFGLPAAMALAVLTAQTGVDTELAEASSYTQEMQAEHTAQAKV